MANATATLTDINRPRPLPDASRVLSGVKPTALLMSGRMVAFAATFFVPVVLARILSQAEFGTYKQLFLIYGTLYYVAQLGMAESLFYFLPSASRQGGRYVANAMLWLGAIGLGCFLVLDAAAPAVAAWLNNPALTSHIGSIGTFLWLMLASSVLEIAMVARGRYLLASTCYGVSDVLRALVFVLPALVFRRIDVLLAGAVVFAIVRLVATLVYLTRTFAADLRPDTGAWRGQLRYTLPFGIATVMEICQANLHLYAVSYYVDAATFAIYAVGCLQIPIVDLIATSAGNVMMVRMGEVLRDGARSPATRLVIWRESSRHLALVLVPLVALLLVSAHALIVALFTTQYAAAAPIFMIWSLAILPAIFMTDAALRAHAQTRFLVVLNAIRLGVIAVCIPWSIATFGLAGAVVLTVVAAFLTKFLALMGVARVLGVRTTALVPWTSLGSIVLGAAMAGVIAAGVLTALGGSTLSALALTAAVFAGVYLALIWRLGVLTARERLAIIERLHRWTGPIYVWNSGHRQPE